MYYVCYETKGLSPIELNGREYVAYGSIEALQMGVLEHQRGFYRVCKAYMEFDLPLTTVVTVLSNPLAFIDYHWTLCKSTIDDASLEMTGVASSEYYISLTRSQKGNNHERPH